MFAPNNTESPRTLESVGVEAGVARSGRVGCNALRPVLARNPDRAASRARMDRRDCCRSLRDRREHFRRTKRSPPPSVARRHLMTRLTAISSRRWRADRRSSLTPNDKRGYRRLTSESGGEERRYCFAHVSAFLEAVVSAYGATAAIGRSDRQFGLPCNCRAPRRRYTALV